MKLSLCLLALGVFVCAQWHVQAEVSSSDIQRAVRAAKARVDSAYEYSRRETLDRVRRNAGSPTDVLRLMKQPAGRTREAVRCADYMDNAIIYLKNMQLNRRRRRSTSNSTDLTAAEMAALSAATGCFQQTLDQSCSNIQNLSEYRTPNSICNNLNHPRWGASNTPFLRLLAPQYQDGSEPKGWDKNRPVNGVILPLVRAVSNQILNTQNVVDNDPLYTMLLTFFGQFTDHDITFTPVSPIILSYPTFQDCSATCVRAEPCFPIEVPSNDPRLTQGQCIPFIRSSPACTRSGTREQMNALTAFLDVGQVYGSDATNARSLRDLTSDKGLLSINTAYTDNGRELLPFSTVTVNSCANRRKITGDNNAIEVPCFVAGDARSNENIALTSIHTLMLREHNRLARKLATLNPQWGGEKLYQEARKILGGMSQVITFRDFLRHIVGPDTMARNLSTYPGYDDKVDPSVANVFATAAFRFAHLMIQPVMARLNEQYNDHPLYPSPFLHTTFFASWRVVFEGGVDPLLRGMIGRPAKLNTQKHMMPDELREKLFKFSSALALDLGSLNMQRGRDHGLPGYNAWRGFCGLSQPRNVDELGQVLNNTDLAKRLLDLYKTPENIDVWLGGISEPLVKGGRVGPLFACLIANQFQRIRRGDRLWWENDGVFTERQRRSLRDANMAQIICANSGIDDIPEDPFMYRPRSDEGYTPCTNIPEFDLSPWQENAQRGPQGPPGPPGPPGPTGPPGPPGPIYKVAFAARLGNNRPQVLSPLVFPEVIYNEQGAYSTTQGIFTCQVPGVYEFSMYLLIFNSDANVDLKLNNDILLHSFTTRSNGYITASGTTLTRLKKGDKVYVAVNTSSCGLDKSSQFIGHLLFTD